MRDVDSREPPTVADIRKLQRLAAKLRKRYLSAKRNSIEIATREAVNYTNACCWSKPCFPNNPASVDTWARNWMSTYQRKFDEVLGAAVGGRFEPCDKCEHPNDRADESNYCSRCSAEYQARVARDPETRPVGSGR